MATPQEVLQGMISDSGEQSDNIQSQLDQIDALIAELEEKAVALEDGVLDVAAADLTEYLDSTKAEDIKPLSVGNDVEVIYGSTYNDTSGNIIAATLTDWEIIDSTALIILYKYQGVNWDNDPIIQKLIDDWNWAHDYLIHPLTTFDGTYGIYPNIEALNNAKSTLEATKVKIDQTGDQLGGYT